MGKEGQGICEDNAKTLILKNVTLGFENCLNFRDVIFEPLFSQNTAGMAQLLLN